MSKFYAVRKGLKVGVFNSWDDCKAVTQGYTGAEYKSFKTEEEANAYLNGSMTANSYNNMIVPEPNKEDANLFTSSLYKDGIIYFGCVIQLSNKKLKFYGKIGYKADNIGFAGELFSTSVGIQIAKDLGVQNINIFYNYDGVERWSKGEWQAKNDLSSHFVGFVTNYRLLNSLNYNFYKITSRLEEQNLAKAMVKKAQTSFIDYIWANDVLSGSLTCANVNFSKVM